MTTFYKTCSIQFLKRLVSVFVLVVLLVPQVVYAEPLLIFYKEDANKAIPWQQAIPKNEKPSATVRLNENGDLLVTYGRMNVIFAYCPSEEPNKQQQPVQLTMALNQEVPPINGVSIRLGFNF